MACARWLNRPRKRARSSAHYILDGRDIVHLVDEEAEAWHAGATANKHGIGLELCGSPNQTREDWLDANSLPMLAHAARLIAELSERHQIPLRVCTGVDLGARRAGVTTHAFVTSAFPADTTHWDPGPAFPLHELVSAARACGNAAPSHSEEAAHPASTPPCS